MPAKYETLNASPASAQALKELAAYWTGLAGERVTLVAALNEVMLRAIEDVADRESMPAAQRARMDALVKRLQDR